VPESYRFAPPPKDSAADEAEAAAGEPIPEAGGEMDPFTGDPVGDAGTEAAAPAPQPAPETHAAPDPFSGGGASAQSPAPAPQQDDDDSDDDLLGLMGPPAAAPAPVAAAPALVNPPAALDQPAFRSRWSALAASPDATLQLAGVPGLDQLAASFGRYGLACLAKGDQGASMKYFLYGQDASNGTFGLAQVIVDKTTASATATVKLEDGCNGVAIGNALQ